MPAISVQVNPAPTSQQMEPLPHPQPAPPAPPQPPPRIPTPPPAYTASPGQPTFYSTQPPEYAQHAPQYPPPTGPPPPQGPYHVPSRAYSTQPPPWPHYPQPPGPYPNSLGGYPRPAYYPPAGSAQPVMAAPVASNTVQNNITIAAPLVRVGPPWYMGYAVLFSCLTIWFLGNYVFGLAGYIVATVGQNATTEAEARRMRTISYGLTGGGLAVSAIIIITIAMVSVPYYSYH